ncbi:helix-turn-helix domain-containing protein [Poseidonibacter lekithochrous]|nr:helix-turn-helix transcriptional regulator [Poseidonibacter lekithochrous]
MNNFTSKDFSLEYTNETVFIKKAKEIIYYNLGEVLDIDEISKELNISKFQFIRTFKANTGITPYQYFLNCKIIHAKKHLDITKDLYGTVVEFAFTDLSHLNRHFKRVYGITAFEYITNLK